MNSGRKTGTPVCAKDTIHMMFDYWNAEWFTFSFRFYGMRRLQAEASGRSTVRHPASGDGGKTTGSLHIIAE